MPEPKDVNFKEIIRKICELQVRNGLSIRGAAEALVPPVALSVDEAEKLSRRRSYQKTLWTERLAYYKELEENPNRTKATAIGMLWLAAQKLSEQGNWKDVAECLYKLARIEGWMDGDQETNVFLTLKPNEIDELKRKLERTIGKPKVETVN